MNGRVLPDHGSGPREVDTYSIEPSLVAMLQRDHARMRKAGGELAEAALRVIRTCDGLHRLSLAVAAWSRAIANEGDRRPQTRGELDALLAHDVRAGMSLRECAERHGVNVGRVRGAVARDRPVPGPTCARCGCPQVVTNLDGDNLCQIHADEWVRAEGRAYRDSDGNPEGEEPASGLRAKHDSAGPKDIAQ